MKVLLIFLLGPISTICGQSASLSALMNKMAQTSSPTQQGKISDLPNIPKTKTGSKIQQNLLPKNPPQEPLHQDVSHSLRLQEQVSQLSKTQLELSRKILSNILQLQTHLPQPLHSVMDTAPRSKQLTTNNQAPSTSKLLKNLEILKANMELVKTPQTNIGTNTKILKEPSTSPRRLGQTLSQDAVANQTAFPQQTIVLVDPAPNNFSINNSSKINRGPSINRTAQPQLFNTIQPMLNAIRSRMTSSISAQVHSSQPQLGQEAISINFVDHLKKSPVTSQIQSANPNILNQASQFQTKLGIGTNQPSNQPILPLNIPKVNNSSFLFATFPSLSANSNPLVPSPPGNIPQANIQKSNPNIFGTDPSSANVQPNPIESNPSNNFGVPQNLPSAFDHNSISHLNPHQSIGSIVSELQTLIAKLEFLQYDFKLSELLQSNPALVPTNSPQSPIIKSPTTNVPGSLKKSSTVLPDHLTSFNSGQRSLAQNNLNHQVNPSTPFINQPPAHMIAAESQVHPVIQRIASESPNQPVSQRRLANTSQTTDQLKHVPSPSINSDKKKFNLNPYAYTYNVRDAATRNFQSKAEMMSIVGDVAGSYAFVDPNGTVSYTNTYNVSGITRLAPAHQFTDQQMPQPLIL